MKYITSMDNPCIICDRNHQNETVEHIIPKSLGNEYYVMPKGMVCYECNNRFAKIENRVVSSKVFIKERRKYGLMSKVNKEIKALENQDLIYFMAKIGMESMYRSKLKIWHQLDWKHVKDFLIERKPSPVFNDRKLPESIQFSSIPGWINWFRLRNNHLSLEYATAEKRLYIRFQFGQIKTWLRLH